MPVAPWKPLLQNFLPICIMLKTLKLIEILKYLCTNTKFGIWHRGTEPVISLNKEHNQSKNTAAFKQNILIKGEGLSEHWPQIISHFSDCHKTRLISSYLQKGTRNTPTKTFWAHHLGQWFSIIFCHAPPEDRCVFTPPEMKYWEYDNINLVICNHCMSCSILHIITWLSKCFYAVLPEFLGIKHKQVIPHFRPCSQ